MLRKLPFLQSYNVRKSDHGPWIIFYNYYDYYFKGLEIPFAEEIKHPSVENESELQFFFPDSYSRQRQLGRKAKDPK